MPRWLGKTARSCHTDGTRSAACGVSVPQALECHVLVIGINAYSSGIAPLQSAVFGDAQAVAQLLQADYGYTLTCLTDAQASSAAICEFLRADAAGRLGDASAFLLYFGGHGVALGDGSAGLQG